MNRRSLVLSWLFITAVLTLSGCRECTHTGSAISVYTRARSADAGPWSGGILVVNGTGFSPHKRIDLTFQGLPVDAATRSSSWSTDQPIAPVTDANGSFSWSISIKSSTTPVATWSRYVRSLPPLDYYADANGEVILTAKEHLSPCSAQASVKAGQLLSPAYEAMAPADSIRATAN